MAAAGDNKKLKSFIERISKGQEEIKDLQDELSELVTDAADATGLAKSSLRRLARETRMSNEERLAIAAEEQMIDDARAALGVLADTPLGASAMENGAAHAAQ